MARDNNYIQIGGFNVWWSGGSQINMQLAEPDERIPVNQTLWITVHPRNKTNYDKLATALREAGKPAPK